MLEIRTLLEKQKVRREEKEMERKKSIPPPPGQFDFTGWGSQDKGEQPWGGGGWLGFVSAFKWRV